MMFRSYSNTYKYFLKDYVTIAMVIILVTMAMPISSHVKDKNSIFTACDEDMIFQQKEKSWDFTGVYVIKIINCQSSQYIKYFTLAVCDGNTHVVALGFDINNFNTKKTVAGYNSFRICKMPLRSKNITNMKVAWLLLKSTELLQMVTANLFLSFRTEKKCLSDLFVLLGQSIKSSHLT